MSKLVELIQIDDLMAECGYSYNYCPNNYKSPDINNGYNCNHPDCEEFEYVKNDNIVDLTKEIRKYVINMITGRKKRIRNKLIKKHWDTRNNYNDDYWIKKLGIIKVGKCYSWSCPIACKADLQDMKEIDMDLYNEYKDEAKGDEGYLDTSDWVVYGKESI